MYELIIKSTETPISKVKLLATVKDLVKVITENNGIFFDFNYIKPVSIHNKDHKQFSLVFKLNIKYLSTLKDICDKSILIDRYMIVRN